MWLLGISVECVFRYWEQTLKKRDVLGREMRVPQEGGKQCVLPGPDWSARNGAESEEK